MNIVETKEIAHGTYEITLAADAAEFEDALQDAYERKREKYALPGFELGSVPREAMEAKEGPEFLQYDAVNLLLGAQADALLEVAVRAADITPLNTPKYNIVSCGNEGFTIALTVGVMPEVTLGQYKDLDFHYPRLEVAPNMIDYQLDMMKAQITAQQGPDKPLPELNDAFAKEYFKCETMAELREKMQTSLDEQIKQQSFQQGCYMLLEEIGQHSTIELPKVLLDSEYDNGMRNLTQHLEQSQVTIEQHLAKVGKTAEEFEKESYHNAARALKGKLSAYAIAKAENITVSDKDVDGEIARLSAMYKVPAATFLAENPRYVIAHELLLRRTLGFLTKASTMTEDVVAK